MSGLAGARHESIWCAARNFCVSAVACRRGGALETVQENVSGLFFDEQTVDSLAKAIHECSEFDWNPAAVRANAERFAEQRFVDEMAECVLGCSA